MEIVIYEPKKHRAAWEDFIVSSYGDPAYVLLSPEYLRWQFLDNPANMTEDYTLWLVLHGGAVVGQLGYVPFIGCSPTAERFTGAYPINLMVRPEYRAAGVGPVLLKRLLGQTFCVLNPGSSEAGAALCAGLGFRDLGCLRRYIAIVDEPAAKKLAAGQNLPTGVRPVPHVESSGRVDALCSAKLPDNAPASFCFPIPAHGVERNRAFMRWRYESHPSFRYEFVLSHDLKSLLVFHEEREESTGTLVIRIVDFLARETAFDALLRVVLRAAQSRGAALVDMYCSVTAYDAALQRCGFYDEAEHADSTIAALFQPLDFRKKGIRVLVSERAGEPASEHVWYITKGDSDQDRPNDKRLLPGKGVPSCSR